MDGPTLNSLFEKADKEASDQKVGDIKGACGYEPLKNPSNKPFRLALSKKAPNSGQMGGAALPAFAEFVSGTSYQMIEAKPEQFNVPTKADPYLDYLTGYLSRAMLTARDQGGIAFNIAGYSKARVQVVRQRYQRMLDEERIKSPNAKFVSHEKFKNAWTPEEHKALGYASQQEIQQQHDDAPGYTDWELGAVLCNPDILAKTDFFDLTSPESIKDNEQNRSDYAAMLSPEQLDSMFPPPKPKLDSKELATRYGIS